MRRIREEREGEEKEKREREKKKKRERKNEMIGKEAEEGKCGCKCCRKRKIEK